MTIDQFVTSNSITIRCEHVPKNPNMDGSAKMDNWHCFLGRGAWHMDVYFSKGKGHNGAQPTADEVLDCLASDASGIESANEDFETWAAEYGYDTDSRKAERTFNTCVDQTAELKRFLGDVDYETLLWNIERL